MQTSATYYLLLRLPYNYSSINLNNTIMKYVQSYQYLGVTIQHDLKYGVHINY